MTTTRAHAHRAFAERFDRGAGLAASGALGLLVAWWVALPVARAVTDRLGVERLAERVAYDRAVGTTQFAVYVVTLACATVAALAFAAFARAAHRSRPGRPPRARTPFGLSWASAIVVALSLATAATISIGAIVIVATAVPLVGLTLAALGAPPAAPAVAAIEPSLRDARLTLVAAIIALAWGLLITLAPAGRAISTACALAPFVLLAASFPRWRRRASDPAVLARDAAASTPLLALPLLGLLRAPSPLWLVAAIAACAALRALRSKRTFTLRAAPALLAWTLGLLVVVPMRLRELPTANHFEHEAHHFAWINSALAGKLLMADASTIYPPLREYVLTAALAITGATLEHARIAFALVNVAALGAMLAVVSRLARRKLLLVAWGGFLLLTTTPLRSIIAYRTSISLGWADLGRVALASVAVVGALDAIIERRRGRIVLWGAVTALALLYSHEFGLCAIGSIVLAGAFDVLMAKGESPSRRILEAARWLGRFSLGVAMPLAIVLAIYAAFGKARLFVTTFFDFLFLLAVGVQQASPFPVDHRQVVSLTDLLRRPSGGGLRIEYLAPPAVYVIAILALVAALVARRWAARDSMRLALLLFGVTTYRVALQRSDVFHLVLAAAPATLLAVQMGEELLARARRHRWALAPLVAAIAASVGIAESQGLIGARLMTTLAGDELPSRGPAYRHGEVPRAGDVYLAPDTEALVRFVRSTSPPAAPIFCRIGFMSGEEIYFLADRQNPTRYDALAEVVTFAQRDELAAALRANPPLLVVGSDVEFIGREAARVISLGWHPIASFGGIVVQVRNTQVQ